jgi:hypothetical protein
MLLAGAGPRRPLHPPRRGAGHRRGSGRPAPPGGLPRRGCPHPVPQRPSRRDGRSYISQFLLQPYTFGGTPVQQRYRTTMPARDHPVRGGHLRRAPRAGPGRAGGQPCDEGGLVPQVAGAPAVPSRGGRRTHPQPPDRSGRLPAPPQADRLGGAVLPGTAATCAPRPTPRAAPPTPPTPVPRPPRRGRGERAQGVLQRSLGDPKPVVPSDDGLSLQPGRASR